MATQTMKRVVENLQQVRQEVIEQLAQIDSALAALGGTIPIRKSNRSKKPCCTKQEVIDVVASLLRDNGELTITEIEGLVKDKLANERNKSLSGFAMRFKEAMSEKQFLSTDSDTYRLANHVE